MHTKSGPSCAGAIQASSSHVLAIRSALLQRSNQLLKVAGKPRPGEHPALGQLQHTCAVERLRRRGLGLGLEPEARSAGRRTNRGPLRARSATRSAHGSPSTTGGWRLDRATLARPPPRRGTLLGREMATGRLRSSPRPPPRLADSGSRPLRLTRAQRRRPYDPIESIRVYLPHRGHPVILLGSRTRTSG